MAASSSSTTNHTHLLNPHITGTTSAPPPTPSTQPNLSSSSDASDTLSRLLHRLPPNLSLPTRLSPRASTPTTNTTSTLPTTSSPSLVPPASFQLGYFQLSTGHTITQQLAELAESEALALHDLTHDQKLTFFPNEWPLGFDHGDEDDAGTRSFCLDGACSTTSEAESAELDLSSLRELTRKLEKVGVEVVQSVMSCMGLENPLAISKKVESKSLMWVSDGDKEGRVYPYVVGLQYQIRSRKWSLMLDSGSVNVEPQVGSVLVTFGDIAQVWSNGKVKKVRGRPTPILEDNKSNSRCISLTLLLTLPLESTVSPVLPTIPSETNAEVEASSSPTFDYHAKGKTYNNEINTYEITTDEDNELDDKDERIFNSFSMEDYAWRVYHERLPSKDPLVRYRIVD